MSKDGIPASSHRKPREESGELWSTFASGVDGRLRIPKSNASLAGWVATNNEIVNIPDVSQDARWAKHVNGYKTKSMLCAPVVLEDQVVAVIQLLNKFLGDNQH
eukprot:Skav217699  [mRNA]  locus=scaffold2294:29161:29995:- [translate_table: standard]